MMDKEQSENNCESMDMLESQIHEVRQQAEAKGDQNVVNLCAIMLAVCAVSYSPDANAVNFNKLIEKFAEKISESLKEALGPMFEQIMGIFMDGWGSLMQSEGDKTTASLGKVGDAINQVALTIENERIKRATAPRPNQCEMDDAALEQKQVESKAQEKMKSRMQMSGLAHIPHSGVEKKRITEPAEVLNNTSVSAEQKQKMIDPSNLAHSSMTSEDVEKAHNYVEILALGATDTVKVPVPPNEGGDVPIGTKLKQSKMLSKASRVEIAKSVFISDIAKREAGDDGQSDHSLTRSQIDNTYYSENWRKGINAMADPTPLCIDMCLQAATTNKLLFDLLEGQNTQNKLLATQLLQDIER
ncbi:hypothetical protein [Shewanella colwelliana]|uniref:hypothetical protein n=1 Tax=Shewanella colwelliana TaxID=23 RepID=UPI0022AEC3BB|nr:hypothetical protein [Shewanella colwelliana]MCZ4337789.1 hypothetical protein [Shewanella colwelliana]